MLLLLVAMPGLSSFSFQTNPIKVEDEDKAWHLLTYAAVSRGKSLRRDQAPIVSFAFCQVPTPAVH